MWIEEIGVPPQADIHAFLRNLGEGSYTDHVMNENTVSSPSRFGGKRLFESTSYSAPTAEKEHSLGFLWLLLLRRYRNRWGDHAQYGL